MKYYLTFLVGVLSIWIYYMTSNNLFYLFEKNWVVSLTMVFGSFVAGATSEGGGAVAFPVFTLLLDISPSIARNFCFAIQSIGMTSASLLIIGMKIPVEWKSIRFASIGGFFGLVFGIYLLDGIFPPKIIKLLFVSLWLSFAIALYLLNKNKNREIIAKIITLDKIEVIKLIVFGFIGGVITSFFGDGVGIFTFCLLTLHYKINEKIATPTAVVLMTINTLIGFFMHVFIVKDFQPVAFNYWLCAIPIVMLFAPLGAYLITLVTRNVVTNFLYIVTIIQYLGAIIILKPSLYLCGISFSIIVFGYLFFRILSKTKNRTISISDNSNPYLEKNQI